MDLKESEVYQRYDDGFVVRRMRLDEEPQVIKWSGTLIDLSVDLQVTLDIRGDDSDGFYVGELNGEMVASLIETPIADDLRYVGYVYVVERYRRRGFARRLITTAHDVAHRRNWVGIIGLDALDYAASMYEKFDYKTAFNTTGYEGILPTSTNRDACTSNIVEVSDADFDRVMSYDDKCFIRPGSIIRRELMSRWVKIPGGRAVMVVSERGDVVGYGCRRPAITAAEHHYIGPLYADSYDIAANLLQQLTRDIVGKRIRMIVIEPNEEAVRLVREMKLESSRTVPMMRMYSNGPLEPLDRRVFAVTSAEVCGF